MSHPPADFLAAPAKAPTKVIYLQFANGDAEAACYEEAHDRLIEQGIVAPTEEQIEETVAYLFDRAEEARRDWEMP